VAEIDDLMLARIEAVQDDVAEVSRRVELLDHAIRGNGRQGLVTDMAVMDARVSRCEAYIKALNALRRWLALGILGFIGSLLWRVMEWFLAST